MTSSESSEDENSALLREAVDTQFIHDGMFKSASTSSTKSPQQFLQVNQNNGQSSLRPNIDKDDQFENFGVTPEFQKYVAKQLSILLDDKLEKKFTNGEIVIDNNLPKRKRRQKGGIKLLKDSEKYLKISKKSEKLTFRKPAESESDNEEKFSEVSVTPNDILNKKDVENWSRRSKAPIYKYKKTKNDTLTSLD